MIMLLISLKLNFQLFSNIDNIGTLNDHVIYVTEQNTDALNKYKDRFLYTRCIIPFQSSKVYVNQQEINVNIQAIPFHYKQPHYIQGNDKGVIINQYTANLIQERCHIDNKQMIGLKVNIPFSYMNYYHDFELTISGIIEESSQLQTAQLYYPYEIVQKQLKEEHMNYSGESLPVYDILVDDSTGYEVSYSLDKDIFAEFEILQGDSSLMCFHPYIEQVLFNRQQFSIVQLAFLSMNIILCIALLIYTIFSTYHSYKKDHYYFSILNILNVT